MLHKILCLMVLLLCGGLAVAQDDEGGDDWPKPTGDCVRIDLIRDFQVLDTKNLIIWAPSRRHPYHLKLFNQCFGLRNAEGVIFEGTLGRLCGGAGDYLVIQDELISRRRTFTPMDRCGIGSVRKLNDETLFELRVEHGKVPPPPPQPEESLEVSDPEEVESDDTEDQ